MKKRRGQTTFAPSSDRRQACFERWAAPLELFLFHEQNPPCSLASCSPPQLANRFELQALSGPSFSYHLNRVRRPPPGPLLG